MKKLLFFVALALTQFAFGQEWMTDFESAKQLAAEQDKRLLLVFQGSDWCAPCRHMEKYIWSTESFKAYAKDSLIMVSCDFPLKKENKLSKDQVAKNEALAEKYNTGGYFPYIIVFNANGDIIDSHGFQTEGPEAYIALLEGLKK